MAQKFFSSFFILSFTLFICGGSVKAQKKEDPLQGFYENLKAGSELYFSLQIFNHGKSITDTKVNLISKGESFRLRIDQFDICYHSGKLTYYDIKDNTFTIQKPNDEELLQMNPLLILSQRNQLFETSLRPDIQKGKTYVLRPKKGSQSIFEKLTIRMKESSSIPVSIEVNDKYGTIYKLHIEKFSPRSDLSTSRFVQKANFYPSAEVIDLRQ